MKISLKILDAEQQNYFLIFFCSRHKFSRRILTDSDTNQLREDLNKHIKNIENGRLFLINKNYFDMFLDYVRENPGRMADAFMKVSCCKILVSFRQK